MKMKVKCCYEDFAQSVIHPIEFDPSSSSSAPPTVRHSPVKQLAPTTSIYSIKHGSSPETRWSMSPKVSSLLRLTRSGSRGHSERKSKKYLDAEDLTRRPRSKTVEETMSPSQLHCKSHCIIIMYHIFMYFYSISCVQIAKTRVCTGQSAQSGRISGARWSFLAYSLYYHFTC